MPDEVSTTTTEAVKKTSDGFVKISVEKYEELLEKSVYKPPVINRTVVHKTAEMLSQENRTWGGTFMGLGASLFVVGVLRYRRA
jgi:phage head maturation protease